MTNPAGHYEKGEQVSSWTEPWEGEELTIKLYHWYHKGVGMWLSWLSTEYTGLTSQCGKGILSPTVSFQCRLS